MFTSDPDDEFLAESGMASKVVAVADLTVLADRPDADRAAQLFD